MVCWWLLTLTGILSSISTCASQGSGIICQNGGVCSQMTTNLCTQCTCPAGYRGSDCREVLMKTSGSVSYRFNASNREIFDKSSFQARLSTIFSPYYNSTVSEQNSTHTTTVNFVAYTTRPTETFNATQFQLNVKAQLTMNLTTEAAFPNHTSVTVLSASANVDECSSKLYTCPRNKVCFNMDNGYGCTCPIGFSLRNGTCIENYCLLSQAPAWPQTATRSIRYSNGTDATSAVGGDKMPYKTYIVYACPKRYSLVNAVTGKAQTDVIECVGSTQTTHNNRGWTGNEVRCDITLQFKVAIVMAAISSIIIVLLAGAFIVGNPKKKKKGESDTEVLGDPNESLGTASF